ncbi:hypothetical protein KC640_00805 [Candidatus Dojkabacteria bacterium]|uniref:Uncharacterized protein n=1 Tax=Candidatus Dojkabacteria bacterium TaxID=2099670 RepID=A0A955ICQ9_9BACT|nr:hypothetical protein [Candidatus Dojkabacteria bacterium]
MTKLGTADRLDDKKYRSRLGIMAAHKLSVLFQDYLAAYANQYHIPETATFPATIELECLLEETEKQFALGPLEFSNFLNIVTGSISDRQYISDFFRFLIRMQTETENILYLAILYWNISGESSSLDEEILLASEHGEQLVQEILGRIYQINLSRNALAETHEFKRLSLTDVATTENLPQQPGMVVTVIDQALMNCSNIIEVTEEAKEYIEQSRSKGKRESRIQDLLRIANTWLSLNTDGKVWKGVIRVLRELASQQGYFTELQLRELNILLQNEQVLKFLSEENTRES